MIVVEGLILWKKNEGIREILNTFAFISNFECNNERILKGGTLFIVAMHCCGFK